MNEQVNRELLSHMLTPTDFCSYKKKASNSSSKCFVLLKHNAYEMNLNTPGFWNNKIQEHFPAYY